MATHALLSPSAAHRWIACPGSVALNKDKPDTSSAAADEGTLAHALAAAMFADPSGHSWPTSNPEMIKQVEKYVEIVNAIVKATGGTLLVEQELDMTAYVPECTGTGDVIILTADEVISIDLKYGANPRNLVVAENNPQPRLYGLGAYWGYGEIAGVKRVRTMIIQPRLDSVTEEVMTVEELLAWGESVKIAAGIALAGLEQLIDELDLNPGPKQCQWCKAKLDCPAYRGIVAGEISADPYEDLPDPIPVPHETDRLGQAMKNVDLIEDFCRAVRAEVERRLVQGVPVDGWKLVEGRKGARAWTDAAAVESLLKEKFRLTIDEMYDKKLISPTSAEKILKESPKRWQQVKELIHQPNGKPSVAPESDKRPALKVSDGSEYADLPEEIV